MSPGSPSNSKNYNSNNNNNNSNSNNRFYQQQQQQYHFQQQQQQQQLQYQNQHQQFLFQQQQQNYHRQQHSLLHHHHHHHHHQAYQQNTINPANQQQQQQLTPRLQTNPSYPQPLIHHRQLQKNNSSSSKQHSPNYLRSQAQLISNGSPLPLPPPPIIPQTVPTTTNQSNRHHHQQQQQQHRQNHHHRDSNRRNYRQSSFRTNLTLPHHPSLPKPPNPERSQTIPLLSLTNNQTQAHQQQQQQQQQQHPHPHPHHPHHHPQPSTSSTTTPTTTPTSSSFSKSNTNNPNSSTHIRHIHSPSTSTLQSSLPPDEQLGLGGPQAAGYFSPSAIELNPWRGCSPCKWKVPLLNTGLPNSPARDHTNLATIDEELDQTHSSVSHLEQDEWKIRWAKLSLVAPEISSDQVSLDQLKPQIANQLHSLRLHFVFDSGGQQSVQGLVLWVYEIPGRLGPKQSYEQPPPLIDPILKTYQTFENHTPIINQPSPIKACQSVISYGVLSYSQLFPNLFTRSTTSNSKPLLPHLSHPAKNRTANDFLVDDSSQTNTIPAYANLLRALNQHIITLAVQSPDSTPFPGACPTRWIRWGPDRLLSVPRDDSLEHLYRNLNRDSTRLMGAILTTAPALVVELKSWLSSRVAMCQPSFTARRLAPMPPLPQHNIPPGFPLILAPFPNLRAQYVRMFGRFNHSLVRCKSGTSSQSSNFSSTRSSWLSDSPSIPNASWISQQKRICRAELKHFEKLKHTWRLAAPFMEAYPEAHSTSATNANQRNFESWVVCKITTNNSEAVNPENNDSQEIELVWPVDHCLLDLESWIESAEQNPPPPPTESDPPASLTPSSRICFPRARLANSLMISAYEPTDELAENAGSYIDWVAQERELQRRAAAAAGKEKTPQKTESPPSMTGGRAGLGLNRGRGSGYPSPRFQRHTSTSTARASPVPPHLITPRMSKKRLRDDGDDRSSSQNSTIFPPSIIPFDCGIVTASDRGDSATVDFASNGLSDENGMDIYHDSTATNLPDPPTSQPQEECSISTVIRDEQQPLSNDTLHQSSSVVLAPSSQPGTTSYQFVSAQQGSGSGSTASTISYNTNLFEQPTPGSVSISGLTPGRLNGFTPDANNNFNNNFNNNNNHPSTQTAHYSSPVNQNHHSTTTDPAGPSEADQLAISENALRTLSLMSSSDSGPSDKLFRFVEPVGYESVRFSHTHTVVDDHYTRRGGKYALPPSPHSFSSPEDEQGDDALDIVDQEVLRRARGPLLVHVSKKLMRAIDPRAKVARTLFNSAIRTSDSQQSFSRAEPLTSSAIALTTQGGTGYAESPATPRSWVPIGSSNDSSDGSTCSEDEDEPDGNEFIRSIDARDRGSCSSTTSSSSSDDERIMAIDREYQHAIAAKIEQIERSLKDVLEIQYRSKFFSIQPSSNHSSRPSQNLSPEDRTIKPKHIPPAVRKKLKNWVSQLATQLEHDPNLEVLLETVLPSTSSPKVTTNDTRKTTEDYRVVLDLASMPIINGFDYYRPQVDDEYEIQENRAQNSTTQKKKAEEEEEKEEKKKLGKQQMKVKEVEEGDQRPYLIKKFTKAPASIVVKINEGKQKIAFSLISQLFKYWIKLGFEPVSGQRDSVLSVIFPRPLPRHAHQPKTKSKDPSLVDSGAETLFVNSQQDKHPLSHLNLPSIHHWLLELAHTYKSCRLGELSIGKIHESKYRSGELKKEIEGMIGEIDGDKISRHTCLIIVDGLEEMKSLGVGEREIVGLDGRPVTRLLISRHQLLDDRPASLISFAMRLYDSMKIHVHRFTAPGLSFDPYLTPAPIRPGECQPPSESEDSSSDAEELPDRAGQPHHSTDEHKQPRRDGRSRHRRPSDRKLLSGHAFFLTGIQKPTQLNIRWPPSGIDVSARHRMLHIGYLVGPQRAWVLVSMVDELGQQHQLVLKFPASPASSDSSLPSHAPAQKQKASLSRELDEHRLEMQIVSSVWKVSRKIILSTNVEWRVVITKLGRIKPIEYEAWCELLSQTLPASEVAFHVTLSSVMMSDVPMLRRVGAGEGPSTTRLSTTRRESVTEGGGGGEGVSDLEMGEVEGPEEGEEGVADRAEGGEEGGGVEKLGGGPEPVWVVHESTLRPHSSFDPQSPTSSMPRSVNATIVHSLSSSYIYSHQCPVSPGSLDSFPSGTTPSGRGGRFRVDLLGTAASPASVYQANLFQHREEVIHSLVLLSRLKHLRSSSQHHPSHSGPSDRPSTDVDVDEDDDETKAAGADLALLPGHLSSLIVLARLLNSHLHRLSDLFLLDQTHLPSALLSPSAFKQHDRDGQLDPFNHHLVDQLDPLILLHN
ncbi:hypothetical protein PGT21_021179 [Puccinia graminis f. sp. tritici]|uniref:Mediator of RNA polymerase II transcription subunit 13 n=1 Tax=Puccinia graminis f. sp. tritici TaxID=56615 RepID=A0A5B0Q2X1_PUCGR|nr:hypothetical protein PGT21_021179 [Puccinia graminis f. sp. tritici]KAA1124543.1 hypothetical protein PGTUg99_013159 [Puccinia graminis f. sp. tritici]